MSYWHIALPALALATLLASACGRTPEVRDFWLSPPPPLEAERAVRVGATIGSPQTEFTYRWSSERGVFDPPRSEAPETYYTPSRQGTAKRTDVILLEILKGERVVAEATFEVEVTPPSAMVETVPEPAQLHAPTARAETAVDGPTRSPPPRIRVTTIPPRDPIGGPNTYAGIAGATSNAPDGARVVLYACTDRCYVQPLISNPFTRIRQDGRWSTWTHTGREYLAFVVPADFARPPATLTDPTTPLPGAIANAIVEGIPHTP